MSRYLRHSFILGGFFFLFGIHFFMWSGCGKSGDKGATCQQNEDCQTDKGLKCLDGFCGDGQKGSHCSNSSHCRTDLGYECLNKTCQKPLLEKITETQHDESQKENITLKENFAENPSPKEEKNTIQPEEKIASKEDLSEKNSPPEPIVEEDGGVQELPPEKPSMKPCRSENDCPKGSYCLIGSDHLHAYCSPPPKSCKTSKDCASLTGTECRLFAPDPKHLSLACLYPYKTATPLKQPGEPCRHDSECKSAQCLVGYDLCGDFCSSDQDCPQGFYCGTYSYFARGTINGCFPKCTNDADCKASGYACKQGHCIVNKTSAGQVGGPCQTAKDCPQGADCNTKWKGGYCLLPCSPSQKVCKKQTDCAKNEQCLLNPYTQEYRCAPQCPQSSSCLFFNTGEAYCFKDCTGDSDCRKEYYCAAVQEKNICLLRGSKKIGETCAADAHCQSGHCRQFPNGRYCTKHCQDHVDCGTGLSCNLFGAEKYCEKDCFTDKDCFTGFKCRQQRCIIPPNTNSLPDGSPCSKDTQCSGGKCLKGALFPNGACSTPCATQTPAGSVCLNFDHQSLSFKNCVQDSDCGRQDFFCYHLLLQDQAHKLISCSSTNPCQSNNRFSVICKAMPDASYCVTGVCIGRGTAQLGERCNSHLACQSGYCYQPPLPTTTKTTSCSMNFNCPRQQPFCDTKNHICVTCLNDSHCNGGRCVQGTCLPSGYCSQNCLNPSDCPKMMQCAEIFNKKKETLGKHCLSKCLSDLQCLSAFSCQQISSSSNACIVAP